MDLTNYRNMQNIKDHRDKIKSIFFLRICGTGMGASACLLKEAGYLVEGADENFYPPMSQYLERAEIVLHDLKSIDWEHVKKFDLVVVGNVVPKMSELARTIEGLGISFCSFPSALGALVLDRQNVIGISGTHGKTTTTYLFSQVFENLGHDPGYFVGGVIAGASSARLGNGKYFFIEADEYDSAYFEKYSKFLSYNINHLVLTSLEFDHADIFESIEDIKEQFQILISQIDGKIFYDESYVASRDIVKDCDHCLYSYGGERPRVIEQGPAGTLFELEYQKKKYNFKTNLVGQHNIMNLSSVILFALSEGHSAVKIQKAIVDLQLVKRRQEVRGTYKGAIVYDDFAHHPTAVEKTLSAIKIKHPDKKITLILEPQSATARSSIFQNEFAKAVTGANEFVICRPAKKTTAIGAESIDPEKMIGATKTQGIESFVVDNREDLLGIIDRLSDSDHVLIIMSNGTCLGLWESSFVDQLEKI